MSRKKFIESQGATCRNWKWSWSFINYQSQIVIFGAWDKYTEGNKSMILDENWSIGYTGRKNSGYTEAREYIRLIEEHGYSLFTFPIIHSDELKDSNGVGPAKIKGFDPVLTQKSLIRIGNIWYASDNMPSFSIPEEVSQPEKYIEGASKRVSINAYERNAKARAACIKHYGPTCAVCNFNFENFYGAIGKGFIHVHHITPLANIRQEYMLDPINDLIPVCPNCHAIIHSTQPPLDIKQLKTYLTKEKNIS